MSSRNNIVLGGDSFQRLFSSSGVISEEPVQEILR